MDQEPAVHRLPIEDRIAWVLELADAHGADFRSPQAVLSRQRHLAAHPTAIAALMCMDGRVNLPLATRSPVGVMTPFRNLGGVFDLGWPHLGEVFSQWVHERTKEARHILVLVTYHYSAGSDARGCAGFNCDLEAGRRQAFDLARQIGDVFGADAGGVHVLVCGFETDLEALVLHGADGSIADLSLMTTGPFPRDRLAALFPSMPAMVLADLAPLLDANLAHVADTRAALADGRRTLDIDHHEWMICLGRGFDFLNAPNTALIIGPYSPTLAEPVIRAAGIIQSNMRRGRIPEDGFLLLTSAHYEHIGPDRARSVVKSRFLARFAADVIAQALPDMARLMRTEMRVTDWRSRRLEAP